MWMNRRACAILCGTLLCLTSSIWAQAPEAPVTQMTPDQLNDLVAPIALYPDSLLAQVLAASTYPLEIVEAQQWLQQNPGLQGSQLLDAAKQQSWDPSVQALVAFPSVMALLNRDIRWTTDLGNAFLAQQADVMNAVQAMRARARDNGRLVSTPQQSVTVATDQGQSAIEIQPANPQVIYVPTYNPAYVWGPPAFGAYPALGYPDTGSGFSFNPGVLIGALFSGLMSFGGWGWGLSWLAHALFLNNLFFGHFGFGGFGGGGGFGAHTAWVHNPSHRLGVAYPNHMVASRFSSGRSYAGLSASRYGGSSVRSGGFQHASSSPGVAARSYESYNHSSAAPSRYSSNAGAGARSYESYNRGSVAASRYNSPAQSYRGSQAFASNYRSAAPAGHYSSPKASSHYSAPKASRAPHMKAPHVSSHSGGHSSGGHSGKHR
jgi:Protein of unknown function (DUF3300)